MKNLLFLVLIAAVLMTAGCTGDDQSAVVTPAQSHASTPVHTTVGAPVRTSMSTPAPQTTYTTVTVPATPVPPTAVTGTSGQGSSQTYTNSEFGFAIQYPKSWTATGAYVTAPGSVKKYKVMFDDPTQTSLQYITVTPDSAGLSLEDWATIFLTQVKNDPTGGVVSQDPLQVDGAPAKKLVLTRGSGKDATESTIIMTVKGSNAYFMEFTSQKDDYPAYSGDAGRMIASFRFT
jgi:hypothetical protein